jgi:N-acetylmuramoyl-L-alanine amidase
VVTKYNIRIAAFFFAAALLLTLFTASYSEAASATVDEIRYFSSKNYTRVVISLDKKADFKSHLLRKDPSIKKPRRFYVDIENARLGKNIKRNIPINDGLLKVARAGQFDNSTVRVVLDIESLKDYKIFPLPNPYRIVIDFFGTKARHTPVTSTEPPVISGVKKVEIPKAKTPAKKINGIRTIVIDPGHGGRDPGAVGKKRLKEKTVTLKIAKMLKKDLARELKKKNGKSPKIILTRTRDKYISLDERTAIANSKEADLFISIHVNASPRRAANGVETYYLRYTQDKDAIRVAARENSATAEEMNDVLGYILRDLESTGNQQESIRLATNIQQTLSKGLKKKYRNVKSNGVKGALFYVLVNCNMPSVLVEVSFISNPRDEKRLRSDKYLREITKGITKGILNYMDGKGAG